MNRPISYIYVQELLRLAEMPRLSEKCSAKLLGLHEVGPDGPWTRWMHALIGAVGRYCFYKNKARFDLIEESFGWKNFHKVQTYVMPQVRVYFELRAGGAVHEHTVIAAGFLVSNL